MASNDDTEDFELEMIRINLNFAQKAVTADPNNKQKRAMVVELAAELLSQEIEIFSRRVKNDPNDLKLKFDLAKRWMRAKKFDKAIPLLEGASKDVRQKTQVLASLGICFLTMKQNELAKSQFERALEYLIPKDNPALFNECHYYLGRIAEEAGDKPTAEKHYRDIQSIDDDQKDVNERPNDIQSDEDESKPINPEDEE